MVTESWSPLGRGRVLADPGVGRVAAELGVTPAQVVIRWHLQHGLVVIPKTTHAQRMRTNADVFSFELDVEAMGVVDALHRGLRTGSHNYIKLYFISLSTSKFINIKKRESF